MPKTNRKQRSLAEIQAILADYDSSMRIPAQCGHPFRRKVASDSG